MKNILALFGFNYRHMGSIRLNSLIEFLINTKKINEDFNITMLFMNNKSKRKYEKKLEEYAINSVLFDVYRYNNWKNIYSFVEENFSDVYYIFYLGIKIRINETIESCEKNIYKWYKQTLVDDKKYFSFVSTLALFLQLFIVIHILLNNKNTRLLHIVDDPAEIDLNHIFKNREISSYEYKIENKINSIVLPVHSYLFFYLNNLKEHKDKKYFFTFGFTSFVSHETEKPNEREKLSIYIEQLKNRFNNLNSNLFFHIKNEDRKLNTLIIINKYLNYIRNSKYTYLLPAYRKGDISILRLLESLSSGCIPILSLNTDFDNSFWSENKCLLEYYKDNKLVIDIWKISEHYTRLESSYKKYINELEYLDFYKRYSSKEFYMNKYENFFKTL